MSDIPSTTRIQKSDKSSPPQDFHTQLPPQKPDSTLSALLTGGGTFVCLNTFYKLITPNSHTSNMRVPLNFENNKVETLGGIGNLLRLFGLNPRVGNKPNNGLYLESKIPISRKLLFLGISLAIGYFKIKLDEYNYEKDLEKFHTKSKK